MILLLLAMAASGDGVPAPRCAPTLDHSHAAWTRLAQRYVRAAGVDYAGIARDARADLRAYLAELGGVCAPQYASWKRAEKLAYWINAYNAFTVELILRHYPVASIRTIGLLPGAAFREDFVELPGLAPVPLSLNDIEHTHLRGELREPRIHFAVVCASRGCPVLLNEAYRAADIDAQLDAAARRFVADPTKNRIDVEGGTVHLSAIFEWFEEDFVSAAGSLHEYVARYAAPQVAAWLRRARPKVRFLAYDWSLNAAEPAP